MKRLKEINWKRVASLTYTAFVTVLIGASLVEPAFAQLTSVSNTLDNVASVVKGAGVAIGGSGCAFAGYKYYFQQGTIKEVRDIVSGSILVGGGTSIVGSLMGWAR